MIVQKNTEVLEALVPLRERRIIDAGCGEGHLVRLMTRRGARVTGLEVQVAQLDKARSEAPAGDEDYLEAGAQAIPLADGVADAVVFWNSLHHVPEAAMDRALEEAARVLRPGGVIYVNEPVASGAFFEVVRLVDDETEVRQRAYGAVRRAPRLGLRLAVGLLFFHPMLLRDEAELERRLVGADGARAAIVAANAAALHARLRTWGQKTEEGYRFEQPTRVNVLVKPAAG